MVQLAVTTEDPLESKADLVIFACAEGDLGAGGLLDRLDGSVGGALRRAMVDERFRAKPGQSISLHMAAPSASVDAAPRRIALVGLGGSDADGGQASNGAAWTRALRAAAGTSVRLASSAGAKSIAFAWSSAVSAADAIVPALQAAAEGALLGIYRFDKYLTDERNRPSTLAEVTLFAPRRLDSA